MQKNHIDSNYPNWANFKRGARREKREGKLEVTMKQGSDSKIESSVAAVILTLKVNCLAVSVTSLIQSIIFIKANYKLYSLNFQSSNFARGEHRRDLLIRL